MVSYWLGNHHVVGFDVVLILVVMEDGLVRIVSEVVAITPHVSLNPCCNGRWSRTFACGEVRGMVAES